MLRALKTRVPQRSPAAQISENHQGFPEGHLLARRSFGKVYQGWWRGGTVAIKVVPHEGDLGAKVEIVRESLLSSSIQHPQIVSLSAYV